MAKTDASEDKFPGKNFPYMKKDYTFALSLTALLNIYVNKWVSRVDQWVSARQQSGKQDEQKDMDNRQDMGTVKKEKSNSEQAIMAAAEELFLEHGYNLTTTTMIARQAGVTHAMLHYYFRTKEHIFIKVLDKNLNEMMSAFQPVMKKGAPFWESMESGISTYFDFLERHPKLPAFLYDTVRFNPELVDRYKPRIRSTIKKIAGFHCRMITEEAAKGAIRDVDPVQLMIDIATLNLSAFMLLPTAQQLFDDEMSEGHLHECIQLRKKETVELIRSRLYNGIPDNAGKDRLSLTDCTGEQETATS